MSLAISNFACCPTERAALRFRTGCRFPKTCPSSTRRKFCTLYHCIVVAIVLDGQCCLGDKGHYAQLFRCSALVCRLLGALRRFKAVLHPRRHLRAYRFRRGIHVRSDRRNPPKRAVRRDMGFPEGTSRRGSSRASTGGGGEPKVLNG